MTRWRRIDGRLVRIEPSYTLLSDGLDSIESCDRESCGIESCDRESCGSESEGMIETEGIIRIGSDDSTLYDTEWSGWNSDTDEISFNYGDESDTDEISFNYSDESDIDDIDDIDDTDSDNTDSGESYDSGKSAELDYGYAYPFEDRDGYDDNRYYSDEYGYESGDESGDESEASNLDNSFDTSTFCSNEESEFSDSCSEIDIDIDDIDLDDENFSECTRALLSLYRDWRQTQLNWANWASRTTQTHGYCCI